jgi:hypothetical protein
MPVMTQLGISPNEVFPVPLLRQVLERLQHFMAVLRSTVILLHNFIEQCTEKARHVTFEKFHADTQTVGVKGKAVPVLN